MSLIRALFASVILLGVLSIAQSLYAIEVPPLRSRVIDLAGIIDESVEQELKRRLTQYEKKTGHQYAVLTVISLMGDPIEDFSIRVVEAWKLGNAERNDGLLLVVVPKERKMRIEVGYGLEGAIPDALAGRVIRNVMVPHFRRGDFGGGISAAIDLLMKAGAGENVKVPGPARAIGRSSGNRGLSVSNLYSLLILLFFAPWVLFPLRRRRSPKDRFYGGGYYGGGFGGGFSGGGGGFSGGGFGGGGASGGW